MADNLTLNAGAGGATLAADDIGGIHYQRVKITFGADGASTDVSTSNLLPVTVDIGKAEDAAAASGDLGVALLTVRQDTIAGATSADGDYQHAKSDSAGRLYVNGSGVTQPVSDAGGSLTVDGTVAATQSGTWNITNISGTVSLPTGASTAANQTTIIGHLDGVEGLLTTIDTDTGNIATDVDTVASTVATIGTTPLVRVAVFDDANNQITSFGGAGGGSGTEYTEDAAAAANPVGGAMIVVRDDARAGSLTSADGDNVALRGTNAGELYVKHVDALTVNSHAVTNAGTFAVQESGAALTSLQLIDNLVLAEDVAHASGDPGVLVLAVRRDTVAVGSGTDGDNSTLNVNSAGRLYVTATVDAALPAGTNNIGDVDVLTLPNVTLAAGTNTNEVVGDAAHDAAIAGNPLRIAGRARTSDYTSVASDDTADLLTTLNGKLVVQPHAIPELSWSYAAASGGITNTTGVTAKTAAGAGIRNYITHVDVVNGHATTSTDVQIRDGASGTVLWRGFAQAAGGGVSADFNPPLRGSANTLVEVACGTTGTATYFNLSGYTGP